MFQRRRGGKRRQKSSKVPDEDRPMSALTPTPLPKLRPDEATQPNLTPGMMPPDDARRGLSRSPAQWEAEALALVEEADAREGAVAGALRYAAARLFEEGVGDVAAAMDHLRLALEEPAETTFRPVLRSLRLHAIEAGSYWTALDLLDVEQKAAGDAGARADLAVEKAYLLEHRLDAPAPARALLEAGLGEQPGHAAALLALEESALRGVGRGEAADAAGPMVLDAGWRRPVPAARGGGCSAGWRSSRRVIRRALRRRLVCGSGRSTRRRGGRRGAGPGGGAAGRGGAGKVFRARACRRHGGRGVDRRRAGRLAGAGGGPLSPPAGSDGARRGADRRRARGRPRGFPRCSSLPSPARSSPVNGRRPGRRSIVRPICRAIATGRRR